MQDTNSSILYDAYYYAHELGDSPCERNDQWLSFFDGIAARIIRDIAPHTVLDAGCAIGFLVEQLRRRGMEAYGIDISEYAIRQAHPDIQPYCRVASICDPLPQRYDLIVSIEVLEHLPSEQTERAIANLCAYTDTVLFSSTPFNYGEVTHYNVQPPEYWTEQFAGHGLYRDVDFDASFITPWAALYRRRPDPIHRILREYERRLWQLRQENQDLRHSALNLRNQFTDLELAKSSLNAQLQARSDTVDALQKEIAAQIAQSAHQEELIQATRARADGLERDQRELQGTIGWLVLQRLQHLRARWAPPNSRREHLLEAAFHKSPAVQPAPVESQRENQPGEMTPQSSEDISQLTNTASGTHRDLLIITPDWLGHTRIGLGMRHWEIARELAAEGLTVTLATPYPAEESLKGDGFQLYTSLTQEHALVLARTHRHVMIQGEVLMSYPDLSTANPHILLDIITPMHIEGVQYSQAVYQHHYDVVRAWMIHGEFFVCGNERQRLYWLGMLTAFDRINKDLSDADYEFRNLIDIVGFGIPERPPVKSKQVLKGVVDGIHPGDCVMLWFGGMWNWLDPLTLIRATQEAATEDSRIKLVFTTTYRPNGELPEMAQSAIQLSKELGAFGRSVFFLDHSVPFADRADYLLESDIGVICQPSSLETQLSARTRVLEYIWGALPVLMNAGDEWSAQVQEKGIGMVVQSRDVLEWKGAILRLARNPEMRTQMAGRIAAMRPDFYWSRQVRPIYQHIIKAAA